MYQQYVLAGLLVPEHDRLHRLQTVEERFSLAGAGGLRGSQVIADEVGIAQHDVVVAHIQVADGAPQVKAGPGTLPSHRRSLTEYFV